MKLYPYQTKGGMEMGNNLKLVQCSPAMKLLLVRCHNNYSQCRVTYLQFMCKQSCYHSNKAPHSQPVRSQRITLMVG